MDNTTQATSEEVWKVIKDTDYSISSHGRVLNKHDKLLETPVNSGGYPSVTLFVSKLPLYCRVHRLVADAFLEVPPFKMTVNHIDGNKLNNNVCNLEWLSLEDNYRHAISNGLMNKGAETYNAILTDDIVIEILDLMKEGFSDIELAAHFGVVRSSMYKIRNGLSWKHIARDKLPTIDRKKKLDAAAIFEIRQLFNTETDTEIARKFNVSSGTIHQIRIGATWKNY